MPISSFVGRAPIIPLSALLIVARPPAKLASFRISELSSALAFTWVEVKIETFYSIAKSFRAVAINDKISSFLRLCPRNSFKTPGEIKI